MESRREPEVDRLQRLVIQSLTERRVIAPAAHPHQEPAAWKPYRDLAHELMSPLETREAQPSRA